MDSSENLDSLFHNAVSAIDAGDVVSLEQLLASHPALVRDRLDSPGAWLRDKLGRSLNGFFRQSYVLWFVAEDPVLHGNPLHHAVCSGCLDAVKVLVETGADPGIKDLAWSYSGSAAG